MLRGFMAANPTDPIDDRTPLMCAAWEGALAELFELLLDGVNLDEQDSMQWTALSHACRAGQYEIVQQLLDSGADPDVHESYSQVATPLILAAEQGNFDIVRLLIAHGADPNNYNGRASVRAEWYARQAGFLEIAEFLRAQEDLQIKAG